MKLYSENNSTDYSSVEGRTYTLNCNGVVGDMVYLTDLDYTSRYGHNIAEVKIYGTCRLILATIVCVFHFKTSLTFP